MDWPPSDVLAGMAPGRARAWPGMAPGRAWRRAPLGPAGGKPGRPGRPGL